jgi:hypothetical protein
VQEWVPEPYETTRTVYTTECKEEKYTAYRCEYECVEKTRVCTVYDRVSEVQTIMKKVCVSVPCWEERTVMKTCVKKVPETHMVRKCVDKGHYECQEVPCGPSLMDHVKKWCSKDCCECEPCPVRTKTKKVWVPCPVWEEHPVTCWKKVVECVPVTCKVKVCKTEVHEEPCQITVWKCVPRQHTETYTCRVPKMVPYEATRTIRVCVPHEEKVTCTRMVCRTVEKKVPVVPACEPCCEVACCKPRHYHRSCGLSIRHSGCCD